MLWRSQTAADYRRSQRLFSCWKPQTTIRFMKGRDFTGQGEGNLGRGCAAHRNRFLCPPSQEEQVIPHGSASYKCGFPFVWHTRVLLIPGRGLVANPWPWPTTYIWTFYYPRVLCFLHSAPWCSAWCELITGQPTSCFQSRIMLSSLTHRHHQTRVTLSSRWQWETEEKGLGGSLKGGGEMWRWQQAACKSHCVIFCIHTCTHAHAQLFHSVNVSKCLSPCYMFSPWSWILSLDLHFLAVHLTPIR